MSPGLKKMMSLQDSEVIFRLIDRVHPATTGRRTDNNLGPERDQLLAQVLLTTEPNQTMEAKVVSDNNKLGYVIILAKIALP